MRPNPEAATPAVRTIEKKFTIYVLKLEKGRFYVGKCLPINLEKRVTMHKEKKGQGAAWTKMFPFVEELKDEYQYDKSPFDEDRKVKELMYKYGFNMVRGGTYSQTMDLSPELVNFLLKQFKGATDECYNCGKKGHFISKCPEKKKQEKPAPIVSQTQVEPQTKAQTMLHAIEQKYWYLPKCTKCHEYGHTSSVCDYNNKQENKYLANITCWLCHRKGHYANTCDERSLEDSFYSEDDDSSFEDEISSEFDQSPRGRGRSYGNNYQYRYNERSRQKRTACYTCGNPYHLSPDCPNQYSQTSRRNYYYKQNSNSRRDYYSDTCNNCGKHGHWESQCYQNPWHKYRKYRD